MNATIQTLPAPAANTKPLWAAVGVLGFAVLAMGASLVYVQTRPVDGHAALAAIATTPLAEPAKSAVTPSESLSAREDLIAAPAEPAPGVNKPAPATAKQPPRVPVVMPSERPVAVVESPKPIAAAPAPAAPAAVLASTGAQADGPAPVTAPPAVVTDSGMVVSQPAVPKTVCRNCGTVESVAAMRKKGQGGGVGAVAGGAIGAVIGNQIGKSSGRTVATILGAIGGGVAGNMIEKNMHKETVYQVRVRMDDGSTRVLEQATMPTVGSKVTVDGSVLHSADSGWSTAAPAKPGRHEQTAPTYDRL